MAWPVVQMKSDDVTDTTEKALGTLSVTVALAAGSPPMFVTRRV